jgi:hypothetical protein
VIGRLERALTDDVEVIGAETWEDAIEALREADPNLVAGTLGVAESSICMTNRKRMGGLRRFNAFASPCWPAIGGARA